MSNVKPAGGKGDGNPAARVGDLHSCPLLIPTPHAGAAIDNPGSEQVLIGGSRAAREGDIVICVGSENRIKTGSSGVLIDGQPAARKADKTTHGGVILTGLPSVLVGTAKVPLSPTQAVALAMIQIRNSKFAKTPEGKLILARLEELYASGRIECKQVNPIASGRYMVGTDTIEINQAHEFAVGQMACLLVHEGTHAVIRSNDEQTTQAEEERCYQNEIAYHEQLVGGSGNQIYDENMRELASHRNNGTLGDELCHRHRSIGHDLRGCYFGAPQNRPGASQQGGGREAH